MDKSTISREFRRNKGQRGWRPKQAQSLRDERRQTYINGKQFSSESWAEVENGKEFAGHACIAAELQTAIYFAHPYRSWERGLNENSNGLLRQYFPKGMALTDVTEEQVQRAVERLNHRPRKVLGFRSLHEVLFGVEVRYTKPT
uniref:IS30 family transposase n=1 Tax=Candidatus Nitrotoga sp. AM1P TaxID=2559597 RepID=UPI00210FF17D|nr:IS30 family transposase [Candidatus Nitrotoga sp. AM1P]